MNELDQTPKDSNKIRRILMWFGAILFMVVFIPYILEYTHILEIFGMKIEKEFGTKEGVILSISFILAIGSKYWDKIASSISNRISNRDKL